MPHKWAEVKGWPKEVQKEYFEALIENYNPSNKELGSMLHLASESFVSKCISSCGIKRPRGGRSLRAPEQITAWDNFIKKSENAAIEFYPEETSISMTGTSNDPALLVMHKFLRLKDGVAYKFTLTATKIEF